MTSPTIPCKSSAIMVRSSVSNKVLRSNGQRAAIVALTVVISNSRAENAIRQDCRCASDHEWRSVFEDSARMVFAQVQTDLVS